MRRLVSVLVIVFMMCSGAWAFTIVDLKPLISTRIVRVGDPVVAVFDSSVNVSTVNPGNFKVRAVSDDSLIPGAFSVTTTSLENDTIIFTPAEPWEFGARYRVEITSGLTDLDGDPFSGDLPDGGEFVPNIPDDFELPEYDPNDPFSCIVRSSIFWGFDPSDPENTDDSKPWTVPGMFVTEAWKYELGADEVIIAVVDNGLDRFDDRELAENFFLNRGELPVPMKDGEPCDYDCDGNGRFNVLDYRWDARVDAGSFLDPGDLIDAFGDGVDDDGNGFPDDICGWDFVLNSPFPIGNDDIPEGTHGGGIAGSCCSAADNGVGDRPGACPRCRVLPIRMSPSILSDFNMLAEGIGYANSMGAMIATAATGCFSYSRRSEDRILDALEGGTTVIAPVGDQLGLEPLLPAAASGVVGINALMLIPPFDLFGEIPFEGIAGFVESFCTNYGPQNEFAVPSYYYCTSEAIGSTAGVFGLAASAALSNGLETSGAQAHMLTQLGADDISGHCFSIIELGAKCREGWDIHFGYGRPNAKRSVLRVVEGSAPLPPSIIVRNPRKYEYIDPLRSPVADVDVAIEGDCSFTYVVELARGADPLDDEFTTIDGGVGNHEISGKVASLHFDYLEDPTIGSLPPRSPWDGFFTLRVRASCLNSDDWVQVRVPLVVRYNHDSVCGFPLDLGGSAGSPLAVDLDGDGYLEVAVSTFGGEVWVVGYDADAGCWSVREGFPVALPDIGGVPQSIAPTAPLAAGDLDGDGYPELVCATVRGNVYAIRHDGNLHTNDAGEPEPFMDGFPVSADPRPEGDYWLGNGFETAPVLADLDMDGSLEIIVAGYDQKVYVWKSQDFDGDGFVDRLSGWPLEARARLGTVPPDSVCEEAREEPYPILGTPVVGICDPDSWDPSVSEYPCIIVTTTEACKSPILPTGRVYAFFWDGDNHPGDKVLPGWPVEPVVPLGDSVPIPAYGWGLSSSPVAMWFNGRLVVGIAGPAWYPLLVFYENEETELMPLHSTLGVAFVNSGAFSDLDSDHVPDYVFPLIRFLRLAGEDKGVFDARVLAWDGPNFMNTILDGPLEEKPMGYSPSTGDLDGDGKREVFAGSGGMVLHAYRTEGGETDGWPKQLGHWITSPPTVADIDNDGSVEVIAVTQKGMLFAFRANSPACMSDGRHASDWWTFHHDERRTGFYGTDTRPPAKVRDLAVKRHKDDVFIFEFTAPGDDHWCGGVAYLEIAAAADESEIETPEGFEANIVKTLERQALFMGGEEVNISFKLPSSLGESWFAVRTRDDEGNYSYPSNAVRATDERAEELDTQDVFCGCGSWL